MSQSTALRQEKLDTRICSNKKCSNSVPIVEGDHTWEWKVHDGSIWFCTMQCVMDYAKSKGKTLVAEHFATGDNVRVIDLQPSTRSITLRPSLS